MSFATTTQCQRTLRHERCTMNKAITGIKLEAEQSLKCSPNIDGERFCATELRSGTRDESRKGDARVVVGRKVISDPRFVRQRFQFDSAQEPATTSQHAAFT
jgi:hypothetical protein